MKSGLDTDNPSQVQAWNEEMIDKFNLVNYFDHPNRIVRWIERKRLKQIIRELQTEDGSRILEVGCGAGQILEQIPRGTLHGFDLSERMVELTRVKITKRAPERLGTIVSGNAQAWPEAIASQSYSHIYCSEVIEHIPRPDLLLKELWNVANTGTKKIIISTPNEPLIQRLKNILIKLKIFKFIFPTLAEKMTDEWHLSSFDIPLMKKLCEGLFTIEKITGAPYNWLPVRYIFTLKKIEHPPQP